MLITSVFVNDRPIDDLFIHNTGNEVDGIYEYEVLDPYTGERIIKESIYHERKAGYRPLLIKVLELLEKHKVEEKVINRDKAFWIKMALEG